MRCSVEANQASPSRHREAVASGRELNSECGPSGRNSQMQKCDPSFFPACRPTDSRTGAATNADRRRGGTAARVARSPRSFFGLRYASAAQTRGCCHSRQLLLDPRSATAALICQPYDRNGWRLGGECACRNSLPGVLVFVRAGHVHQGASLVLIRRRPTALARSHRTASILLVVVTTALDRASKAGPCLRGDRFRRGPQRHEDSALEVVSPTAVPSPSPVASLLRRNRIRCVHRILIRGRVVECHP